MKKLQLFIILLVILGLMAYADLVVNVPEGVDLPNIPDITGQKEEPKTPVETPSITHPNVTQAVLDSSDLSDTYKVEKRTRTTALFESFDLKALPNISMYQNVLTSPLDSAFPLYIYEIHGPEGQGKITYLNIKLRLIDQLGSSANINETGSYGFNSLFYNDEANSGTGFLLSQIDDMVFGFQYSKNTGNAFDSVKKFVETYMSEVTP